MINSINNFFKKVPNYYLKPKPLSEGIVYNFRQLYHWKGSVLNKKTIEIVRL